MILAALLLQAAAPRPPLGPDVAHDPDFNGVAACRRDELENGKPVIRYLGDRACVRFKPARRYVGLWVNAFEGQQFVAGATQRRDLSGRRFDVWFSTDARTRHDERGPCPRQHVCRIVFDGAEAVNMHRPPLQGYGHMSDTPGLVLADQVIAIVDLGPL